MILRSLRRASVYHPPALGAAVIRCHHIPRQPGITVDGASRVRFRLRRTLKSILRLCFRCWSHTPRVSESVQQSFPSSSVAPFTTKILLPAYTSQLRSLGVSPHWAFHSILIYTFLTMTPIQPKTSNQSVELTATRSALTLSMTTSLQLRATLALGGGSSLLSR